MLNTKKGLPEERELVLCTVTKIFPHCVFVNLDEYRESGMVHISEISPGRIRNIHDYVKIGKKIVCKVLRIDPVKRHIDLSLRRVSESQKREKANEIKQEQKAEKIIEFAANKLKIDKKKLFEMINSTKMVEDYGSLYNCFEDYIYDPAALTDYISDKKVLKVLDEEIKSRIKPKQVQILGEFDIKVFDSGGVDVIKSTFSDAQKISDSINFKYIGGGKYSVFVVSEDYKDAEKILKQVTDLITDSIEKHDGEVGFARSD